MTADGTDIVSVNSEENFTTRIKCIFSQRTARVKHQYSQDQSRGNWKLENGTTVLQRSRFCYNIILKLHQSFKWMLPFFQMKLVDYF